MSDIDSAVRLYQDAVRHLDDVIHVIEDLPVHRLPDGHYGTATQILTDAYALRRAITTAQHALQP